MCNFYNISYTGMSTVVTHTLEASTLFPRDRVTGCTAGLGPERFWMCFARLLSTGLCEPVLQGRGRPVFHCIKGWDQNVLPKALGLSGLLELLDRSELLLSLPGGADHRKSHPRTSRCPRALRSGCCHACPWEGAAP